MMYKTLLVLLWAGCVVDYESASFSGIPVDVLRSTALLLTGLVTALFPPPAPHSGPENLPVHSRALLGENGGRVQTVSRPSTVNCTTSELAVIHAAVPLAAEYVINALGELRREGADGDNFRHWFGSPNKNRFSTVLSNFQALNQDDFAQYTFVCNPHKCIEQDTEFAFVDYSVIGTLNLCPGFFRAPETGRNSRPSIIVHEATHFYRNGFTDDHARDVAAAERLARSFPHLAVLNAENYEYFAADARDGGGLDS